MRRAIVPRALLTIVLAACAPPSGMGTSGQLGGDPGDQAAPGRTPDLGDLGDRGDLASGGGTVKILVEPGDKGAALLAALNGAQRSLHMTMYMLTDAGIKSALIARHQAGVDVRVVLNRSFPQGSVTNQAAYDALQAAGVPVVWAPAGFTYTHEKCVVIDGATAWIMTMNAATSSLTSNREYLAVDTQPADVAEAEAQFAADFAGQRYDPRGPLLLSPVTSRPALAQLIIGARTTLDFEDEELSDLALTGALCDAKRRGVRVRGVLAAGALSGPEQAAVNQLKTCGVPVGTLATPYLHAKAIVADGARAYVGSENLTVVSLDQNRELGLITEVPSAVRTVATQVAADIAAGTAL